MGKAFLPLMAPAMGCVCVCVCVCAWLELSCRRATHVNLILQSVNLSHAHFSNSTSFVAATRVSSVQKTAIGFLLHFSSFTSSSAFSLSLRRALLLQHFTSCLLADTHPRRRQSWSGASSVTSPQAVPV